MTTVATPLGEVKGVSEPGCEIFLGLRYARATTGELRFRPPLPAEPWTDVFDATARGPVAPQIPRLESVLPQLDQQVSEDCLRLNVFTPAADDRRRPVLVWVHGGSYVWGSANSYDGRSFCREGDIVVVTLNYRLGLWGFVELGHLDRELEGSHNNGIRDLIEGLRWVRANIAAFGGDPDRVTLCGQSAGAGCVLALLASPAADGLYHRCIAQSPPARLGRPHSEDPDRLLAALGGESPATLTDLRAADLDRLLEVEARLENVPAPDRLRLHRSDRAGTRPVVDDITITAEPVEAIRRRGADNVPLLIGTTLDEGTLFALGLPEVVTEADLLAALDEHTDHPGRVLDAFRREHPGEDLRSIAVHILTDTLFRAPTLDVADAQTAGGASCHVYRFSWRSQGFDGLFGATHALDIP
ncbi:MAG: carboxylesterase/lipase family protein, partial [Acidimicrobiales bacterium]